MSDIRVRFAPSPTGFLHVGGARTAIFNWLYARRHGGVFVLRIEDTDARRSSEELVEVILDGLAWLGLSIDEGPYYQSRARERHVTDARLLLDAGLAYRCFCSPEALQQARAAAPQGGRDYAYPRTCRELPVAQAEARAAGGEPHAVRFAVPPGEVGWDDLVHGRTVIPDAVIEDFVLLRSDGSPTYQISVVSDDTEMRISHVIRGDDHLSNTPKQILLYRALGRSVPTFAHLPLIHGEDRKRLSKRHGAVSLLEYRDRGYLPQAMLNFLALLGWNPGDDREKLAGEELVHAFDLGGVGKSGAVFDLKKLDWLNGQYINELPTAELADLVRPRLARAGLWRAAFEDAERDDFLRALALMKTRARTLDDFATQGRPYFDRADEIPYDPQAEKKQLKGEGLAGHLQSWIEVLEDLGEWEPEALEQRLRELAERRGIGAGRLIHPTRLALTGQAVSPGIFEVLQAIGRERSLCRLRRLLRHVESRGAG